MYAPAGVKTSKDFPIPDTMKAWVLGDPGQLTLKDKPVPVPRKAEVLVRIDAVAICAEPQGSLHRMRVADVVEARLVFVWNRD